MTQRARLFDHENDTEMKLRLAKTAVGAFLLIWGGLLIVWPVPTESKAVTNAERYVGNEHLLTPFILVAVSISLVLSARWTQKR